MKDIIFKFGTLLLALMGVSSCKTCNSESKDVQKKQDINKTNNIIPLYLDEANPSVEDNNGKIRHHSHYSHVSHYSSKLS